jgi:predicted RNase H-like nuclease
VKTTFIGIDLAWKSARNPTGAAVLNGDRLGARLEVSSTLSPEASVADFISANATANTVVAIDAPLVIVNETGQRACETAIGKKYGSREASCHTSNLKLYHDASSIALTAALLAQGFTHVDPARTKQSGRIVAEVYPHAAMVALWDLPKTIKYKRGALGAKRVGLSMLRSHLTTLGKTEPPLLRSGVLQEVLSTDLNELVGQSLKNHEDRLDAMFCAYLAYYFWYWGWERNEIFGNTTSGYILNPKLTASEEFER